MTPSDRITCCKYHKKLASKITPRYIEALHKKGGKLHQGRTRIFTFWQQFVWESDLTNEDTSTSYDYCNHYRGYKDWCSICNARIARYFVWAKSKKQKQLQEVCSKRCGFIKILREI